MSRHLRGRGEVVVGVVSHSDACEEEREDAGEADRVGDGVGEESRD